MLGAVPRDHRSSLSQEVYSPGLDDSQHRWDGRSAPGLARTAAQTFRPVKPAELLGPAPF